MHQKCVKNASKMRKMGLALLGKEERSKMRQKCVKFASKMRGTPLGENTLSSDMHALTLPYVNPPLFWDDMSLVSERV